MSVATPNFITGKAAFEGWAGDLLSGTGPTVYAVGGAPWAPLEVAAGSIVLLGGAPGAGKTALPTQLAFEAAELLPPDEHVLIANVEMNPAALQDRQLARFSGHNAADVRFRRIDQNDDALLDGMARLLSISDRIAFLHPRRRFAGTTLMIQSRTSPILSTFSEAGSFARHSARSAIHLFRRASCASLSNATPKTSIAATAPWACRSVL